jgi:hypothetical protein
MVTSGKNGALAELKRDPVEKDQSRPKEGAKVKLMPAKKV